MISRIRERRSEPETDPGPQHPRHRQLATRSDHLTSPNNAKLRNSGVRAQLANRPSMERRQLRWQRTLGDQVVVVAKVMA